MAFIKNLCKSKIYYIKYKVLSHLSDGDVEKLVVDILNREWWWPDMPFQVMEGLDIKQTMVANQVRNFEKTVEMAEKIASCLCKTVEMAGNSVCVKWSHQMTRRVSLFILQNGGSMWNGRDGRDFLLVVPVLEVFHVSKRLYFSVLVYVVQTLETLVKGRGFSRVARCLP